MDNLEFLKQVLMSDTHYWIVARKESAMVYGEYKRMDDSLWFISIDPQIELIKTYTQITLADIETLNNSAVQNIALTEDYPPFQQGITMRSIYKGWPVSETKGIKEVMIDAINLKSKDFYDYEKIVLNHNQK